MSDDNKKQTKHNLLVRILSKQPITYDTALFRLVESIDLEKLLENDLLVLGFDFEDSEPGTHRKKERGQSRIAELAARSPGVIGDLMSLLKGRSKRDLYIGFCGVFLLAYLLYQWTFRLVTGTF